MHSTSRMRLEGCAAVASCRTRLYVPAKDGCKLPTPGRVVDVAPHIEGAPATHEPVKD